MIVLNVSRHLSFLTKPGLVQTESTYLHVPVGSLGDHGLLRCLYFTPKGTPTIDSVSLGDWLMWASKDLSGGGNVTHIMSLDYRLPTGGSLMLLSGLCGSSNEMVWTSFTIPVEFWLNIFVLNFLLTIERYHGFCNWTMHRTRTEVASRVWNAVEKAAGSHFMRIGCISYHIRFAYMWTLWSLRI